MNNKLLSFVKFIVGWPLSLVALFFISRLILSSTESIQSLFRFPNFYLLIPGVLTLSAYFFIRSYIWQILLRESGHKIPLRETSYLWATSEFKRFVPGYVWTVVGKTISFTQKGIGKKTLVNLIFSEIDFFMLGTLLVSLLSLNFISENFIYLNLPAKGAIIIFAVIISLLFVFNQVLLKKIKFPILTRIANFIMPPFTPTVNLKLLALSVFDHFLFGLGTFLVISSVIYLPIEKSLALVGFFALSLLAGYLSVITPVGLGVREGLITFGLSKIITLQAAGFASIVARAGLLAGEIICLVFLSVIRNIKSKFMPNLEDFVKKNLHILLLGLSILIYILYFTAISFLRQDNFFTGRFDLGNMDQVVWNTINGRIFEFSNPDGFNITSRLSFHADFLLILLSPLYLIWSDPKALLLFQTIVLGLGSTFIYLISKDLLKNKNISLILAISYLLNPSVQLTNLYDFHPVVPATTFLLGAFYFLHKNKYSWFFLFLFLIVISKEQLWVIAALFGLYILFTKKKKLLGISITVVSLTLFYLLVSHIIPKIHGGEHFAVSYYSEFGDSPAGIIKNVIFSPVLTISTLLSENSLVYLYKLFLHVGFLPLANPLMLVFALPDLAINILSSNPQFKQLYYQYTAVITPFIFISSIYSINFLSKRIKFLKLNFFGWYLFIFMIISSYYFGPLPFSKNPNISVFTQQLEYRKEVVNELKKIPQEASVAASNNLGAHLSQRQYLFTIPMGVEEADYITLLLTDNFAQPSLSYQIHLANNLKSNPNYKIVFEKEKFILLKKISSPL